jgi:hypothetical protein
MRHTALLLALAVLAPAGAQNLIRNGSFELPDKVGTTRMLQGQEPMQYHWGDGKTMFIFWQPTGAEGWWSVGINPGRERLDWVDAASQIPGTAHSGKRSLRLTATDKPVGVVCGAGQILPPGKVTFSVWVLPREATGRVRFDCLPDNSNMSAGFLQESATARAEVPLPTGASSQWVRLSGTIDVPKTTPPQQMAVRIQVDKGSVFVDDVQVEAGEKATEFNVRPAEQVQVHVESPRALPVFVAGKTPTATLTIRNAGARPLTGDLQVGIARWDKEDRRVVRRERLANWQPGATMTVPVPLSGLRPDAYIAFARVESGGQVLLDGLAEFDGAIPAGGTISCAMMRAPSVARFAITDARPNRELFGSGNMMVNTGGSWWGGYPVADYIEARALGFRYSREGINDDATYRLAAGGMRSLGDGPRPWTAPDDLAAADQNPVHKGYADLSSEAAWGKIEPMWRKLAADLKGNPVFPLMHITGEEMVLYQGALCPTVAADLDFRNWVKARYGTLEAVSQAWGRPVKAWDDIEQIISERMVREKVVAVEKDQEKRVDWRGAADKLNAEQGTFLKADPGRGMDWLRWRSDVYLRSVARIAKVFHSVNPDTLLCNHFCWPDFVPQTSFGLARRLDALGIDTQYPCGLPGSLGTPAETIDMMGIYEAFADQKPVWGMEIYIQPKFPAEMPATQVWGFIAHGMKVVNNFAWKPYSDAGLNAKRWNEPGAPPWWFIIDFDGKHMPQFDPLVRATREVNAFDAKYGGATLKRAKPDAAFFVSEDAGVLSHFDTLGQWWNSPIVHARCELGWLLRLNSVRLDYLDDALLAERLKDYRTVFVPYSPNVSDTSLQHLADFARSGGTVVFAGPCGWQDPWLKARPNVGGAAFADLNWKVADFEPKSVEGVKALDTLATVAPLASVAGAGAGSLPGGKPLMAGADGKPAAWEHSFGQGRVIALDVFPSAYSQSPHADAANVELVGKLTKLAGVTPRAAWHTDVASTPEKLAGEGAPVVDVMMRKKSDRELFLFVMNIGGEGSGEVRLNLDGAGWKLTDALTGDAVMATADGRIPMKLRPWGYQVVRMVK